MENETIMSSMIDAVKLMLPGGVYRAESRRQIESGETDGNAMVGACLTDAIFGMKYLGAVAGTATHLYQRAPEVKSMFVETYQVASPLLENLLS